MNDMTPVIVPKSDQISADDLIGGPMTVTIRDVKIAPGTEQPVSIILEETDRLFRPCKSMSRVMVYGWGPDASKYIGRSLTLYRDPEVKWGGLAVGGIRISHMSHIDSTQTMVLAVTKGSRKPYKVMPLKVEASKPTTSDDPAAKWTATLIAAIDATETHDALAALQTKHGKKLTEMAEKRPDLHKLVEAAVQAKAASTPEPALDDDPFADDTPTATKFADGILADLDGVGTIIDLDALFKKAEPHLVAMDEADAATIRGAFDAKRGTLTEQAA